MNDTFLKEKIEANVPIVLEWAIGNLSCSEAQTTNGKAVGTVEYAMKAMKEVLIYFLVAQCHYPEKFPCYGTCVNTVGNYTWKCKEGYSGDAKIRDGCRRKPFQPLVLYIGNSSLFSLIDCWLRFVLTKCALQRQTQSYNKKQSLHIFATTFVEGYLSKPRRRKWRRWWSEMETTVVVGNGSGDLLLLEDGGGRRREGGGGWQQVWRLAVARRRWWSATVVSNGKTVVVGNGKTAMDLTFTATLLQTLQRPLLEKWIIVELNIYLIPHSTSRISWLQVHSVYLRIIQIGQVNKFTVIGCNDFAWLTSRTKSRDVSTGYMVFCSEPEDDLARECSVVISMSLKMWRSFHVTELVLKLQGITHANANEDILVMLRFMMVVDINHSHCFYCLQ
ncbi:hypothetical protein Ccrd_024491, partial [Cynara cardunculus var. scolymus]